MSGPIRTEALIHDLAIVLHGALHPSAGLGPGPRLAASRIRDVLGVTAGELTAGIEDRLRAVMDVERSFTEWCVWWGGEDPNECSGGLTYDDEAEADEMTQWITGGRIAYRTVTHGLWVTPDPQPGETP